MRKTRILNGKIQHGRYWKIADMVKKLTDWQSIIGQNNIKHNVLKRICGEKF